MSYLVLARKYRPSTFAEVVGQDHVTRTLGNAFATGRVHHAFLFCGPRGCGKTTLARIVGKALNCEARVAQVPGEPAGQPDAGTMAGATRPPGTLSGATPPGALPPTALPPASAAEPCGVCAACTSISNGSAVDYQEMDGASNRGIDAIRELTEAVRYQPAVLRKKVYVIDEVHMLTTEAFNALLKTLEEPPPHVTFVLATTEPHKLPNTILSRCQRYDFKLVPASRLAQHLTSIFTRERLSIEPGAVSLVVRESGGSVRDALSLCDQLISYVGEASAVMTERHVAEVLGVADRSLTRALVRALASGDAGAALAAVESAIERGVDEVQLARAIVRYLRDLSVLQVAPGRRGLIDATEEELAELGAEAAALERSRTTQMFERMLRCCDELGKTLQPRLVLDCALIDVATIEPLVPLGDLIDRLTELEGRLAGRSARPGGGGGAKDRSRPMPAPAIPPRPAAQRTAPPSGSGAGSGTGSGTGGASASGSSAVPAGSPGPHAAASGGSSPPNQSAGAAPAGPSRAPVAGEHAALAGSSGRYEAMMAAELPGGASRAEDVKPVSEPGGSSGRYEAMMAAELPGGASRAGDVKPVSEPGGSSGRYEAMMAAELSGGASRGAALPVAPPSGTSQHREVAMTEDPAALAGARRPHVNNDDDDDGPGAPQGTTSRAAGMVMAARGDLSAPVSMQPSIGRSHGRSIGRSIEPSGPVPKPQTVAAGSGPHDQGDAGAPRFAIPTSAAEALRAWNDVLGELEAMRKFSLLGPFQHARVMQWTADLLELGFPVEVHSMGDMAKDGADELRAILRALGPALKNLRVTVRLLDAGESRTTGARSVLEATQERTSAERSKREAEARAHPITKHVLQTFGAQIKEIKTDV